MQPYLVIGLGNPGNAYTTTRHNSGFRAVDAFADQHLASFVPVRLAHKATCTYRGRTLTLIKPTTYMNDSGKAVRYWLQALRIPPSRTLVITDDIALPLGTLRLRLRGGNGGHNGLKSIAEMVQTTDYPRLRIGIGRNFHPGAQADYVLASFSPDEEAVLSQTWPRAVEMIRHHCFNGHRNS